MRVVSRFYIMRMIFKDLSRFSTMRMIFKSSMFSGSPWADKITLAILDYHESGLMEDLDNKWILRSKWSRSPNLLILTSSAISLFLAGRRTRIAKTRTGTTRSHWAWRTCGGWAPLSSSSCSPSSSSPGVHPGRPWDSWRSWSHRRRDSLSQTQGDHHRDHHHHMHHGCGDHHLAGQVRRERRAEAAKDAINRWKGTIEVTTDYWQLFLQCRWRSWCCCWEWLSVKSSFLHLAMSMIRDLVI